MPKSAKFTASVVNGSMNVDESERFSKYLQELDNGIVTVTISPQRFTRSNQQNRYYHGVVIRDIANHQNMTAEDTHEALKSLFLNEWIDFGTKKIRIVKSTASLNTVEMEEYLSKCREFASLELGLWIPEPNEVLQEI